MSKTLLHLFRRRHNRRTFKIDEVEEYNRSNPFILTGYRGNLKYIECLQSVFEFHNETLNIWTHLLGFVFFAGIFIRDLLYLSPLQTEVTFVDFMLLVGIIICYQATMILSALFHTFTCHSKKVSESCLSLDLMGITLGLLATYLSGIYYAFYCHDWWRDFYLTTVGSIFLLASAVQMWPKFAAEEFALLRISLFTIWAIYGLVPTIHWIYLQGGFVGIVPVLLPRIFIMYGICGIAFFFYLTKLPERAVPGLVDIIGHSHQWWHTFVFLALLFWHNTGVEFAIFLIKNGCNEVSEDDISHLKLWPF